MEPLLFKIGTAAVSIFLG